MVAIDLSITSATLAEILDLASEDNVVLKTREGRQFVLAEIDDFAVEVDRVRANKALMELLRKRSGEKTTYTLAQIRERLQGKRKPRQKGHVNKRKE